MKPKVYIETTIIGYLASRISRDIVTAGHQKMTQEWWEKRRDRFDLFGSELVIEEATRGDVKMAEKRKAFLEPLQILVTTEESLKLAQLLVMRKAIPKKASGDAFHLAIAAIHGLDFLLTWNCKHLANASLRGLIEKTCKRAGFQAPIICTPEELFEEEPNVRG